MRAITMRGRSAGSGRADRRSSLHHAIYFIFNHAATTQPRPPFPESNDQNKMLYQRNDNDAHD